MTNKIKRQYTKELIRQLDIIQQQITVLEALDADETCSGYYDLHDQFPRLKNDHKNLLASASKCLQVIPSEV